MCPLGQPTAACAGPGRGVEQDIILAIVLSLLDHVGRGYRAKNSVTVATDTGGWRVLPVTRPVQVGPGLMIYRFMHL